MDDLPILAFEKVLSYLPLEDRIRSRAVSRRWYKTISSIKPTKVCFSERPSDTIYRKNRLIAGEFAQNFISSSKFRKFFYTFNQSILSNLKHLRLCELQLYSRSLAVFTQTLSSFSRLEELDIIRLYFLGLQYNHIEVEVNLPVLKSIQLEKLDGIFRLNLDAPRLEKVKLLYCSSSLRLHIVHGESVERLIIDQAEQVDVNRLKSLKYFYCQDLPRIGSAFLSGHEQLREIHLASSDKVGQLFEQKQRCNRADLKIYLWGCLADRPDDPAINYGFEFSDETLGTLAQNPARLAHEIPFCTLLNYLLIERVPPGLALNFPNRFTDLDQIIVCRPVQDTQRFLDFLKHFDHIAELHFLCDQPQELFDRLPEHSSVQSLTISSLPSDLEFLFELERLIYLHLPSLFDAEFIRKVFEKFRFVSWFGFRILNRLFTIETIETAGYPKIFRVSTDGKWTQFLDLNAAIQFVMKGTPKKRKAGELE